MKFSFSLMGVQIVAFEFAMPSRGIYPVPEEIWSEAELDAVNNYIFDTFEPDDDEDE